MLTPVCRLILFVMKLQYQQAMWDYHRLPHLSPVWLAMFERILAISWRSLQLLTPDTTCRKILGSSQRDFIKRADFLTLPLWSILLTIWSSDKQRVLVTFFVSQNLKSCVLLLRATIKEWDRCVTSMSLNGGIKLMNSAVWHILSFRTD